MVYVGRSSAHLEFHSAGLRTVAGTRGMGPVFSGDLSAEERPSVGGRSHPVFPRLVVLYPDTDSSCMCSRVELSWLEVLDPSF